MSIIKTTFYHGDCLEEFKRIQSDSIDLILTDPPYGNMKGIKMRGVENQHDWDIAIEPASIFANANRVLRENGRLVLFSQEPYTAKLITNSINSLPFNYRMIWVKNKCANQQNCKKAHVSYYEDILVFTKKFDRFRNGYDTHPLREYARELLGYIGKKVQHVQYDMKNTNASHFLRPDALQFCLCTDETYNFFIENYNIKNWDGYKEYNELKDIEDNFKINIEQLFTPTFNLPKGKRTRSNVLRFKKPDKTIHPTQKPVALLLDIIETYTNEGDTVLDFTFGSGSTGAACARCRRDFIGIEKDDIYFNSGKQRIEKEVENCITLWD